MPEQFRSEQPEGNEEDQYQRMEDIDKSLNELIRKEQGWDAKTQSKSKKGGLSESEREELNKLSKEFSELGGMDKLREMRDNRESK